MKKFIFILLIICNSFAFSHAQSVVFSDNFDSYAVGTSVGTLGYSMWECGATIQASVPANSGTNYASIVGNAGKSNYMRKTIAVTAGHSYTFSAFTSAPVSHNHSLGYQFASGASAGTTAFTNTAWTQHTLDFTATNTENVAVYIYVYGAFTINTDDWSVTDNTTATSVKAIENNQIQVIKSLEGQITIKGCEVSVCNIFNVQGKLVKTSSANSFYLSDLSKGVYLMEVIDKSGNIYNQKLLW